MNSRGIILSQCSFGILHQPFCDYIQGLESRENRMADQCLFQSGEDGHSSLAQGREIAADATKGLGADSRTETAGDLLLDFDHTNIALCEAIVERHSKVVQKSQHRFLVGGEPIEQIASRDYLRRPRRPTHCGGSGGLA